MNGNQTRDRYKIVDALDRGYHEDARHRLRAFEGKYGQTDETRALAAQLDQLGPDAPRGPGPRTRQEASRLIARSLLDRGSRPAG